MKIITRAGKQLAVGGEWMLPTNKVEAKELLFELKENLVAIYKIGELEAIGSFPDKGSGKVHAGALVVCQVLKNAIIVEEVGDGLFWFVVLKDGVPMPTTDRLCSKDEANYAVTDAIAFNENAIVIGNTSAATTTLDDVLAQASNTQWGKALLSYQSRSSRGLYIRLAIVVAALGGGGAYIYHVVQGGDVKVDTEQQRRAAATAKARDDRLKDEQLRGYSLQVQQQIKKQVEDFDLGHTLAPVSAMVSHYVHTVPVQLNGWEVNQVTCQLGAAVTCTSMRQAIPGEGTAESAASIQGAPSDLKSLMQDSIQFSLPAPHLEQSHVGLASQEGVLHLASLAKRFPQLQVNVIPTQQDVMAVIDKPTFTFEFQAPKPVRIGSTLEWSAMIPEYLLDDALSLMTIPGLRVSSISLSNLKGGIPTVNLQGQILFR